MWIVFPPGDNSEFQCFTDYLQSQNRSINHTYPPFPCVSCGCLTAWETGEHGSLQSTLGFIICSQMFQ